MAENWLSELEGSGTRVVDIKFYLCFRQRSFLPKKYSLWKTVGKSVTDSGYAYVMQWF